MVCRGRSFYVKTNKFGDTAREDTIDHKLDNTEGSHWCSDISRVENLIAINRDERVIGITFLWENFANHQSVGYLFLAVGGNVNTVDDIEGVSD